MPRKNTSPTKQTQSRSLERGEKLHYTKTMIKKRGRMYWRVIEKPTNVIVKEDDRNNDESLDNPEGINLNTACYAPKPVFIYLKFTTYLIYKFETKSTQQINKY